MKTDFNRTDVRLETELAGKVTLIEQVIPADMIIHHFSHSPASFLLPFDIFLGKSDLFKNIAEMCSLEVTKSCCNCVKKFWWLKLQPTPQRRTHAVLIPPFFQR